MISRTHRFRHRLAVQAIYKQAKTVRGQSISLKYVIKSGQPWRAAVVVSKKVSKSAVTRNRIRRRIFEWLRKNENLITPGNQMIISVFDERVANLDASELSKILEDLVKKSQS